MVCICLQAQAEDQNNRRLPDAELREQFQRPPASVRPWCYWYWMAGNISREGIVADLDGFARVGIGGVYLMEIGNTSAVGDVTYRSPAGWELFTFAVSEAAKRNIKVSFHCPGWSASGGPWITPDRAMQEVVWSETTLEGGKPFSGSLSQSASRLGYYRDIAIIAFPQLPGDEPFPAPTITAPDGRVLRIGPGEPPLPKEFDLVYPAPVTARSLFIRAGQWNHFDATLSYWDDAERAFKTVTRCRRVVTGPFSERAGAASFDAVRASKFRLTFHNEGKLMSVSLTGGSRISKWVDKAGYSDADAGGGCVDILQNDETEERQGQAIPKEAVVDLSDKMDEKGVLTWTPPPGRWTVLRFGHTPTGIGIEPPPPGGKGLECDKLNADAVNFHYDQCVSPVLKRLGPELVKSTLMYYHVDSYEASWQTWTQGFQQQFLALRGYDLRTYLPCLTGRKVGDAAQSERFLWDYRRTISDLFASAHYRQLAKRCEADGIRFSSEPYNGPFRSLQVGNEADHPMIEFWTFVNPRQPGGGIMCKAGIFCGHVNERPVIGAEAFTSEDGWTEYPYSIKALGDFAYCEGVNRFVLHVSAHQPWLDEHLKPGLTCGGNGTHFDRGNTWWEQGAPEFIGGYLSRCQALLQQGEPQGDVLYLQSDDSPSTYGPFEPKLPEGYVFGACDAGTLDRLKVKEGRLVLPKGKTYRYLVLPTNKRLTLASLKSVGALAEQGAQVVGPVPEVSPSLGDAGKAEDYAALARALLKRVRPEKTFQEILAKDNLRPSFAWDKDNNLLLRATQRRCDDREIFFVANASAVGGTAECRFNVTGKVPELWHPDSGRIETCAVYREAEGMTHLPLSFDPSGSVFVVFRPGAAGLHVQQVKAAEPVTSPETAPALVIRKATYGSGKAVPRDVTKPLAQRSDGRRLVVSNFTSLDGDPEPYVVKTLTVDYEYNGKAESVAVKDGETLLLPKEVQAGLPYMILKKESGVVLQSTQSGSYQLGLSDGTQKTIVVPSVPAPMEIAGPWDVRFPEGWGAPGHARFERLVSWPEHADEGIKYFSGTAAYTCSFKVEDSSRRLRLDLGRVEVIAKVTLNGQSLGVLWKPPFVYDISGKVRNGDNDLKVEVTNLWPNRLIGDENYPDDCTPDHSWLKGGLSALPEWIKLKQPRPEPRRLTFTWCKHWQKGDSLLPSGLLGPVRLVPYTEIDVVKTNF
jgi:hypothetical protein